MKRFFAAALSLLCVLTVARLVAQDSTDPVLDPFPETLPDDVGAAATVSEPPGENTQQGRFLEIMRTKAELMDDAELDAAIPQAEAEIQNLQASRMLTDARETLLHLIETYPQTPAAQDARRMLSLEVAPTLAPAIPHFPDYDNPNPSFTAPVESTSFDSSPESEPPTVDEVRPLSFEPN